MGTKKTKPDFTNGVPELLVLLLLSRQSMHGYALASAIRAATGEALQFGEGSIYPVLHRLEQEGMLTAKEKEVGGRRRLVYRVTPSGLAQLKESVATWERVVSAVRLVLQGGS